MSINPYAPPSWPDVAGLPEAELRTLACQRFRLSHLILLVPAILNLVCFNWLQPPVFVLGNSLGFVAIGLFVWFLGFGTVDRVSSLLHGLVCGNRAHQEWNRTLYLRLISLPGFVAVGSLLWILWVVGFYLMGMSFYFISYLVGVPAHILAACFYIPLIMNWYRIARPRHVRASRGD